MSKTLQRAYEKLILPKLREQMPSMQTSRRQHKRNWKAIKATDKKRTTMKHESLTNVEGEI